MHAVSTENYHAQNWTILLGFILAKIESTVKKSGLDPDFCIKSGFIPFLLPQAAASGINPSSVAPEKNTEF